MAKGSGNGKTPQKVIDLLKVAVANSSQSAVSRELEIGVAAINRYLNGVGEPTLATLEKLADYFDTSVECLLGYDDENMRIIIANTEKIGDALHSLHNEIGSNNKLYEEVHKYLIEIEMAYAAIYDVAINRLFTKDGKDVLIEKQRVKLQTITDKTHAILEEIPDEVMPVILKRLGEKYPDGNIPSVREDNPVKQLKQIAAKRNKNKK